MKGRRQSDILTLFTDWKTASMFPVRKAVVKESLNTLETFTAEFIFTVTDETASLVEK